MTKDQLLNIRRHALGILKEVEKHLEPKEIREQGDVSFLDNRYSGVDVEEIKRKSRLY